VERREEEVIKPALRRTTMKTQQILAGLIVVLLVCGFAPFASGQAKSAGTLTIVNQYGGGVYYLTIERGSGGGPRKISPSSRAERPKRVEEGKMYGTSAVIADGDSKSYSLEAGSYFVSLNFHKPGRGVYTMTDPPIVITAGQTRTLTITADGKLNY
jgi:hypothetical protein